MRSNKNEKDEVKISAPWGGKQQFMQSSKLRDSEATKHFVEERSKVHTMFIVEQEKTKRLGLVLSVILLIAAMLIVLFSPEDKEVVSYWIGGALLLFSAGAAGYKRIWAKTPLFEVDADH
jgi:hypothetical protein